MVFASMIFPDPIQSFNSRGVNQCVSMRSSSIGFASPALSPVARKIVIFSATNPGLG